MSNKEEITILLQANDEDEALPEVSKSCFSCLWESIRDEFHLQYFGFEYSDVRVFYTSPWKFPQYFHLFIRGCLSAYTCIVIILTIAYFPSSSNMPWPIYLTNWSYFTLTFHQLLSFLICFMHTMFDGQHTMVGGPRPFPNDGDSPRGGFIGIGGKKSNTHYYSSIDYRTGEEESIDVNSDTKQLAPIEKSSEPIDRFDLFPVSDTRPNLESIHLVTSPSLPFYIKLDWIMFSISSTAAIYLTIINSMRAIQSLVLFHHVELEEKDIQNHYLNSLVVLIDIIFNRIPVRLFHLIYPVIFNCIFTVFTVILWALDNDHLVYNWLNWNRPQNGTIDYFLKEAFLYYPLCFLLVWFLVELRDFISKKYFLRMNE